MATQLEEPKYTVIHSYDAFELRRYDTNIQARVQTSGGGAASGGFRVLHATSSEEIKRVNPSP